MSLHTRSTMHRPMRRRISFQTGDFEITGREIAFSTIIVLVMIVIGLFVNNAITNAVAESNEQYYLATKITDQDQFQYGLQTAIGDVLAYGTIEATEPVSMPEIKGEWFYIGKVREKYTRHTRTVTETDSEGNKKTKTEIYYTWDHVGSEVKNTESYTFMGIEFQNNLSGVPENRINLAEYALWTDRVWGNYLYEDSWLFESVGDVRYYFYAVPQKFNGTIAAKLKQNELVGFNGEQNVSLYYETIIPQIMGDLENGEQTASMIFWIVWIIVIGLILFGFYYIDNRWLES